MPENENTLVIMAGVKTQNIAKSNDRFGLNPKRSLERFEDFSKASFHHASF